MFPIAETLRARDVPFLFHTGHGERSELQQRFAGALVCIKPVLPEDLVRAVAGLLRP